MSRIDYQAIRAQHDLVRFFEKIGVKLRRVGRYFTGRCPFHDERHGNALIVYSDQRRWFCYGKCRRGGDIIRALSLLDGVSESEAATKLLSSDAVKYSNPCRWETPRRELDRKAIALPNLTIPTKRELVQVCDLRSINQTPLRIAVARGFLRTYTDNKEGRIWCLTDKSERLVIARRLDGKPWEHCGGEWIADPADRPKSKNLYGSHGNWPLGIQESEFFPAIGLVEGAPNFLSVIAHAWASNVENIVAPVCLSGAAHSIPGDALPYFFGKRVRIFTDDDFAGYKGCRRWWGQLESVGCNIDAFTFEGLKQSDGRPVNDLNDLLRVDCDDWEANREVIERVMTFATEQGEPK
jgi:hypothetical protein